MTASGSDSCIGAVKYVGAGPLTHWKVLFYDVLEKIQTVAVNTTEGANSQRSNLFLLFSVHFQCCSSASVLRFSSSLCFYLIFYHV